MREHFDLDPSIIYLNSGTESILPREILEATTRHQREGNLNPTATFVAGYPKIWQAQQALAQFFNARPEDLLLRSNVTEALNLFILGTPLKASGEILTTDVEYGAVANICRYRAERDGLKLRTTPTRDLLSALTPDTRMLVVSHVVTGTGERLPIQEIARETRRRGIFFVVDGAHAAGAIPLDFGRLDDVDFYGTNLHKWMMGPRGTGFGWVPKRNHELLKPIEAGWTTFETPTPYDAFADRFTAKYALNGTRDFAAFLTIKEMLAFWQRHGFERINARRLALQRHVETRMQELEWPQLTPADPEQRGPLLTYELPERLAREGGPLAQRIYREHKLQVATPTVQNRTVLRVSPHIYNTEAEIDRAFEVLRQL